MLYIAADKQIRKKINFPVRYKLVFITLTLSSVQLHSDRVIKQRLLQPFLRVLRNRFKCGNYIWKAEVQDNGNIHFHIITDVFIHYMELRSVWNTIQDNLGYVERSKSSNPNSTDIHAICRSDFVNEYLSYVSKKDDYKKKNLKADHRHYYHDFNSIIGCDLQTRQVVGIKRKVEGKFYDCNSELKKIKCTWNFNLDLANQVDILREIPGNYFFNDQFFRYTKIPDIHNPVARAAKFVLDFYLVKTFNPAAY